MAPKLRFVVTGMVLFAAFLGAMLPWRAQKFSSPSVDAADSADASSVGKSAALPALVSPAQTMSTPPKGPLPGEHTAEKALTMKIAAMPSNDFLLPPPSARRLRDEVSENPHRPPPCVMRFAAGWAAKMQQAKTDELLADRLVTQAEQWVGDGQPVVPVIQAICLSNTKLLAAAHQTLAQRYEAMRQRAGADVLRLAEQTK